MFNINYIICLRLVANKCFYFTFIGFNKLGNLCYQINQFKYNQLFRNGRIIKCSCLYNSKCFNKWMERISYY